jgi:hypothetical protein
MSQEEFSGDQTMEAAVPANDVQSESQEGGSQGEHNVPLQALQAERAQRQNLQEELRVVKDHIALMQSQQSQPRQEPVKDEMDGLSDDDVLTVGEAKKFLSKIDKQHQMSIQELKMVQKHPDYQSVVSKYLPEVLKTNPGLRNTLQQSQDFELAYYLAKNSDSYKSENKKAKKNADAERIVQNSQQVGSLGGMGSNSPVNQAKRYKEMSDSEFQAAVNRNIGAF